MDYAATLQTTSLVMLGIGLAGLFWVDLRHGILPDKIVFPLAVIGGALIFIHPIGPLSPFDSIIGACVGLGGMAAIRWVAGQFFKREAMGLGDVKFMGMAGIWVGWQGLNALLIGGALFSLVIALFYQLITRHSVKGLSRGVEIPLGPGLCLALALVIIHNYITNRLMLPTLVMTY